ncbi:MAG: DUF4252 domain-containing protein [Bacteroidales bacterium]|nr:DUF4252 domain-containing protein [Bacteroidales bacterium]
MKRLLVLIFLTFLCSCALQARDRNARLQSVVNSFRKEEGFDLVTLGTPVIKLLLMAYDKSAESPENRAAADLFRDIKKLVIADYSDCPPEVKEQFRKELDDIFSDEEPIMEVSENGSLVVIYGELSEDGTRIRNVSLREDGDGSLIFLNGSVSVEHVTDLSGGAPLPA